MSCNGARILPTPTPLHILYFVTLRYKVGVSLCGEHWTVNKSCAVLICDLKMDYVSKYVPECIKQIPVYMVRLCLFNSDKCSYNNGWYFHFASLPARTYGPYLAHVRTCLKLPEMNVAVLVWLDPTTIVCWVFANCKIVLNAREYSSSTGYHIQSNYLVRKSSQCCWRTQALLSLYVSIVEKTLILILIIFSIKLRSVSGTGQVDSVIVLYVLERPKFIESCLK